MSTPIPPGFRTPQPGSALHGGRTRSSTPASGYTADLSAGSGRKSRGRARLARVGGGGGDGEEGDGSCGSGGNGGGGRGGNGDGDADDDVGDVGGDVGEDQGGGNRGGDEVLLLKEGEWICGSCTVINQVRGGL